ncbi:zinc-ribbon domain-containing protein [Aliiroseovarius sp. YM-037]|uniref:zinc-ribbon domain-containing protein n=1 Tax=Aliiroseovarius sp. YM-037 TaxID=3341728 RepID=UPI003A7FEAAA
MRLICPNCDAQYEVDDSVIPAEGRDVQCSNCGQTWFQKSAAMLAEEGEDLPDTTEYDEQPSVEVEDHVEDDTPAEDHDVYDDDTVEDDDDLIPDEPEEDRAEPEPRALDQAVLDVLRQEAELESKAREDETASGLETQPDLGIDEGDSAAPAAVAAGISRTQSADDGAGDLSDRRDLLPDIEEINSTLRASDDRGDDADVDEPQDVVERRRGGFRFGFLLMVILFAIGVLVYRYAPAIIDAWPGGEGIITGYVNWVNDMRVWLDGIMSSAIESLSGLLEGDG